MKSLVLVDGGFPMATPPGLTPENVAVGFADRVGRLGRTWDSLDEYLDYFCSTAPLLDPDDPLLRDYLAHDLRDGRVRLSGDALVGDADVDLLRRHALAATSTLPVRFLHAEWSTGPDTRAGVPARDGRAVRRAAATVVGTSRASTTRAAS